MGVVVLGCGGVAEVRQLWYEVQGEQQVRVVKRKTPSRLDHRLEQVDSTLVTRHRLLTPARLERSTDTLLTMSYASLDLSSLLLAHTGLSALASLSNAPLYAVPVALYGLVTVQRGLEGSPGAEAGRTVRLVPLPRSKWGAH